jgi:hypothetical protein
MHASGFLYGRWQHHMFNGYQRPYASGELYRRSGECRQHLHDNNLRAYGRWSDSRSDLHTSCRDLGK